MTPRLGLMVRSDNRGIGSQSGDLAKWLDPAKMLLVRMGRWTSAEEHPERYPGARHAIFDGYAGTLPTDAMAWLLDGVDVVMAVETPMDFRLWTMARERGVGSVVVANPEFYRHELEPALPRPDVVVNPSPWRMEAMPGATHVTQPVDRSRFPFAQRPLGEPVRFVHVIGRQAIWDRAGTDILLSALRYVRHPIDLIIRSQGPLSAAQRLAWQRLGAAVRPKVLVGDLPDPAALYASSDVLVAPRRYGGLSLPLMEAASCGLAVVATDRVPESGWLPPECLIPCTHGKQGRFQGGMIAMDDANPQELARILERLAANPAEVASLSARSDVWAESVSWQVLLQRWQDVLGLAASRQGWRPELAVAR